ncbi:MAG: hypothetical protein NZ849_09410 [Meiothermus sp.]|uniref:hypothetical protein n=1 Tax=Meiothermus sp. TaxID=1955249 RepID=UPI0025F63D81|nr:hypothetical protein [Meiothermus sp.]MCS7058508.1 hypothetical protein [Meiothermus sp.]MCS7195107.1 hypothetical protein [Meiothermus sp.]MCX7740259.1 hypothetical protein [Meiothermus sp.]MDW8091039.1 hypothetical protein [Meiothermus sp.]MDW8480928.1 hypothetical protein [Meiothermus sp.]
MQKKCLVLAAILSALSLSALAQPAPPPSSSGSPVPAPRSADYREAERAARELARTQYLAGIVGQSPLKATAETLLRQAQGEYQAGQYFRARERAHAASLVLEALRFQEVAPTAPHPAGRGGRRAYEAPFRAQEAIARAEYEADYYRVNAPAVNQLIQEAKRLLAQGNDLARAEAAHRLARAAHHLMKAERGF